MSDLSYRYEESGDRESDDESAPAMVVSVDDFSARSVGRVVDFLCEDASLRFLPLMQARPLFVDFGKDSQVSERLFWSTYVERNQGRAEGVIRYLDAVIACSGDSKLPYCSAYDVLGGHGIYAYLDRYLEVVRIHGDTQVKYFDPVTEAFLRFLRHCDIDHETWHRRYVDELLSMYSFRKKENLFPEFFLFYLDTQWGEEVMSLDTLSGEGTLKTVVDHFLNKEDGWLLRVDVLRACSHVYGSQMDLTADVLSYCRSRKPIGDSHDLKNFSRSLEYQRRSADVQMKYYPPKRLDTGFHTFDGKSWTRRNNIDWDYQPDASDQ